MRQPRIKINPDLGEGVYHCRSRTVNGEWLFKEVEQELFRKLLWQVSDFCGVQVLTYVILSNHFHLLLRVPQTVPVSDAELLRRFGVLHPKPTRSEAAQLAVIQQQLAVNGPNAVAWRKRMLALMGDVSQCMKILKQRFTVWFNATHDRFGPLWAERFGSSMGEPVGRTRKTMAAYIDLNCVRAGLTEDPMNYRFCGYAEAVAGDEKARAGLMQVTSCATWDEAQAGYRQMLFGTGADPRENCGRVTPEQLAQVIREEGKLPLPVLLRCRVRYFTDGAILGTLAFVNSHLAAYRQRTGRFRTQPKPLPEITGCTDLAVLRRVRGFTLG
jgi:putative transposase